MKTAVVSYSLSGNNAALAGGLARKLNADYYEVRERGRRSTFTIVKDVIFNRFPAIEPIEGDLEGYDNLLLVAPIWMGRIASPLRTLCRSISGRVPRYSFVSFSAGADGFNPKLDQELTTLTGRAPEKVLNPLIRDLLPSGPKPDRNALNAYRLTGAAAEKLINDITAQITGTLR